MSETATNELAPPPIWSRRTFVPLAAASVSLLAAAIVLAFVFPVPLTLEQAEGPLDVLGFVFWVMAAPLALLAALRGPRREDRLTSAWLGVVAVLAAMRELDLHHRLRPERIGEWGMRFRADWWLSSDVPIGPKLVWGAVALVLAAVLIAPLVSVRVPAFRLMARGDTPGWLLAAGVVLLACGYMMDDLMRHSPYISKANRWRVEETCETLGAAAYLAAVACATRWPLSGRIAALAQRL